MSAVSTTPGVGTNAMGADDDRPRLDIENGQDFETVRAIVKPPGGRSFTLRAAIVGLAIGVLVCMSNIYFGLQTGVSSSMSSASTLIGFAIIKTLSPLQKSLHFSAEENVLVQTVAGAAGCMTATAGLLAAIPALEFLARPDENGPLRLSYGQLVLWSLGVGFFGLIFAMSMRERFVVREPLPYPGARATASLIKTLHRKSLSEQPNVDIEVNNSPPDEATLGAGSKDPEVTALAQDWQVKIKALSGAAIGSGLITMLCYFVPLLRNLPVLGVPARDTWLWSLNVSPGFIGTGIIAGPIISLHMLLGAIVGWGILSPLARSRGWAAGDVGDWDDGSRGWIVWIGLAALLADALVKLGWPLVAAAKDTLRRKNHSDSGYSLLAGSDHSTDNVDHQYNPEKITGYHRVTLISLAAASIFCVLASKIVFGFMPIYAIVIAVALSFPLSVMGIRAVGETDVNPIAGIGKVSQLIFAVVVPRSNPYAVLINLIAGSIAEAGASQAGDLAFDLKIGYIVGAEAQVQLYGQIIGCFFGTFVTCGLYRMYTAVYKIPDKRFQIPVGYMAIIAARLVTGKGLPDHALEFVLGFGIFFIITTAIKIRYASYQWQNILPSGVAFAVGIYVTPSFSLARMIGGLINWYCSFSRGGTSDLLIVVASGLILGEGLCSMITLFLP